MADATGGEIGLLLLGRYRIERKLGEGGLGTVVAAFDTRLKRRVAIKTLKRAAARDVEYHALLEQRFTREAEAGSRVGSHPNLVTVHDLVTDVDGTLYLILEFVPGGTLAERIARGPLPLEDALRIAHDIARGLQAAHRRGLVHRDVKPANVFIGDEGQAQVGDFGIAQIDDLSARTYATAGHPGTPLYLSPEQANTAGYLRPASDQYGLGLVLFEMLTRTAYKRLDPRAAFDLLAAYPQPVRALVERMLAPDPADRYPTMAEAGDAIRRIARLYTGDTALEAARLDTVETEQRETERPAGGAATLPIAPRSDTPRLALEPARAVDPPLVVTHRSADGAEMRRRGRGRFAAIVGVIVLVLAIGSGSLGIAATHRGAPPADPRMQHYDRAAQALAANDIDTAIAEFTAAGQYRDASQRVIAAQQQRADAQRDAERQQAYREGNDALAREDYAAAAAAFARAGEYRDAPDQLTLAQTRGAQQRQYQTGDAAFGREDYTAAAIAFRAAGQYRDAPGRVAQSEDLRARQVSYDAGASAFMREDFKAARQAFIAAGDYKDAPRRAAIADEEDGLLTTYTSAQTHLRANQFAEAYADLQQIKGRRPVYKDVNEIIGHLEGDVANPITLDLFVVLNQANGYASAWVPVNNLIGRPVGYLYVASRRSFPSQGRPDLIGSVSVALVAQQGGTTALGTEIAIFATDTELQDSNGLRRGEKLYVAASVGQIFESADLGKYRARWTITNITTQQKAPITGTVVSANPVFTRLVIAATFTAK